MTDSLGAVAADTLADIVILNGNPLDDARAVRRIHGAIANGRLLLEQRPPVIDMHHHSAQLTPKAYAQMGASSIRYVFLSSTTADLKAWAAEADPKRYLPALVFPCEAGRAPGPGAGRQCLDDASEFPDVTWLRAEIRAGRIKAVGEVAPPYMGISPADPRLEPYWQLADEFDILSAFIWARVRPARRTIRARLRSSTGLSACPQATHCCSRRCCGGTSGVGCSSCTRTASARLDGRAPVRTPKCVRGCAALENPTIVPREGYYRYLRALVESGFGQAHHVRFRIHEPVRRRRGCDPRRGFPECGSESRHPVQ